MPPKGGNVLKSQRYAQVMENIKKQKEEAKELLKNLKKTKKKEDKRHKRLMNSAAKLDAKTSWSWQASTSTLWPRSQLLLLSAAFPSNHLPLLKDHQRPAKAAEDRQDQEFLDRQHRQHRLMMQRRMLHQGT